MIGKGGKQQGMLTELAAASENRREATTSCIAPEIRNMMEQFEWNIFRATRDYLGMERGEIARWLRLCERLMRR